MAEMIDYRVFPATSDEDKALREAARNEGVTVYHICDIIRSGEEKGLVFLKAAGKTAFARKKVTFNDIQDLKWEDATLFFNVKLERLRIIASRRGIRGVNWKRYIKTVWGTLFMNGGIEGRTYV